MPLEARDIKIEILRRDDTLTELARRWETTPDVLSRVIHRRPPYLYPKVQERLADYLGVPVSEIGREPSPRRQPKAEAETAEAAATVA